MYRMLIIVKKIGLKDWFICYICATGGGGVKLYWILQQKPPQLIYSSRVWWFNRPMRDELEFWLKNNFILPPSPSLHPPSTLDLTALFTIYLFSYRPDFGYQISCEPLRPPPPPCQSMIGFDRSFHELFVLKPPRLLAISHGIPSI